LAAAQPQGLVKVIADSRWDEILGVHIIGANATDIIAQASIAMTAELCSEDIANTVFAHPTFSEAFMNACGGINNQQ
jgi:dihydrolipoamide dehydrogenase